MGNFVLAVAIIFGGWWLLRKLASSQPRQVRGLTRKLAGGAIITVAGFLMLRGASNIAIPLFILGAGLVGETALFPNGLQWPGADRAPPRQAPASRGSMTRDEAYAVLGLKPGATVADVRAAHRRLMKDFHPDHGGSNYLAIKINQAKDLLFQDLGATT
ncbi:MAG: DnaJ domain-containing protein [Rhizobiales bacterium]|nr:DnaJ domain-containing protein [Hyphomicrobiales bacterium]